MRASRPIERPSSGAKRSEAVPTTAINRNGQDPHKLKSKSLGAQTFVSRRLVKSFRGTEGAGVPPNVLRLRRTALRATALQTPIDDRASEEGYRRPPSLET